MEMRMAKEYIYVDVSDVKFIEPETISMWKRKIDECMITVDILYGLANTIGKERSHYNLKIEFPLFWKKTTLSIVYNHDAYQFIIKSGFALNQDSLETQVLNLCYVFQNHLNNLLKIMKSQLPSARFSEVLSKKS